MSANITIYCLEQITDYLEFERLCNDLMALEGYADIEPLGGFSDKGRDAIHVDKDKSTIFAYSVREDWKIKLLEDATKVRRHGHACDELVFVTTSSITVAARDNAIKDIKEKFGWSLKIFGLERLRVLLETNHPEVRANYPQIFPPEFFKAQLPDRANTAIYILYSNEDAIFTTWLSQKLLSFGYRVWCDLTNHLLDESIPDDANEIIEYKAGIVLSVLSNAALMDMDHANKRFLALKVGADRGREHLFVLTPDGQLAHDRLDQETRSLKLTDFSANWGEGLISLSRQLDRLGILKPIVNGKSLVARAFDEQDVILDEGENVFLNLYEVIEVPKAIQRFESDVEIDRHISREWQFIWPHRWVNDHTFLSFFTPPDSITQQYNFKPSGGGLTGQTQWLDGIFVKNLISELIKKSLYAKCIQMGLSYCPNQKLYYFPDGLLPGNKLWYTKPDGTKTWILVSGERKHWTPSKEDYYWYQLAPVFYVSQNLFADFVVTVRIKIRISDLKNRPLDSKKAFTRRKRLTHDWWNKEWGDRFFAITEFLSDDGKIVIGSKKNEQVMLDTKPFGLLSPSSINEEQVSKEKGNWIWGGDPLDEEEGDTDEE